MQSLVSVIRGNLDRLLGPSIARNDLCWTGKFFSSIPTFFYPLSSMHFRVSLVCDGSFLHIQAGVFQFFSKLCSRGVFMAIGIQDRLYE